ncbi:MAG: undecaprenyl/decaprenyl-phosphate alpha-N-acetylglucosaminyl 1-phosphate transferase [Candidatus Omnitrophica bacterium]|nr:undecaprenyl/decaprenyl-phosphate alpha-N-acetylglucosaminyl 1-phosphate transferase [Candidatus Omnitrophota bacterium]
MVRNYVSVALVSFLSVISATLLFKKLACRHKVMMLKDIPLVGGLSLGVIFSLLCPVFLWFYGGLSREIFGTVFASLIMLIFGVIDDLRELSVLVKFAAQIIATCFLIAFNIRTHIVGIGEIPNLIVTFIWVIGITNALNHLDIIDALATGVASIAALAFFIIAVLNNDIPTAIVACILFGGLCGFLSFNFPPAKIYMGNSGSHFLGFLLASIALIISYAPLERKAALLSPLFILGFPLFDTAFLVIVRIIKKSLPFKKSNDHLALRFLALGYSKKKALVVMLSISFYFSFCGVCISQLSNLWGAGITALSILGSLALIFKMYRLNNNA